MIARVRLRLTVAALLLVSLGAPARAQIERVGRALELIRTERQTDGRTLYFYQLLGPSRGAPHAEVILSVTAPRDTDETRLPRITERNGTFLFDATADTLAAPEWGHPPLGVWTPRGWSASIRVDGWLSWSATHQGPRGQSTAVPAGATQAGFALVSGAVPALRPYQVTRETRITYWNDETRPFIDSTEILMTGYVLGPGWMPNEVHWGFLYEQVVHACAAGFVVRCADYKAWVQRFQRAHARRNDEEHQAAIRGMRAALAQDRAIAPVARIVFSAALDAMTARPPSRLPPMPASAAFPAR